MSEWIVVTSFKRIKGADDAKSKLSGAHIPCFLMLKDGQFVVNVRSGQWQEAKQILKIQ